MAKKAFPFLFPQASELPADQYSQLSGAYNRAKADYELQPYADVHPYKAALVGLLTGGVPGAFTAKATSQAYRDAQQDQDVKNWTDAYSNAFKNQEALDKSNAPRNYLAGRQSQFQTLRDRGFIDPNTPNLYDTSLPNTPYMDAAQTDALFKSAAGGADIQALANNLPGFTKLGMNQSNYKTGKTGELQTGVGSYTPDLPPVIVNPDALQSQLSAGYQTGLGQGLERYKFDQEAPKRNQEVLNLRQDGRIKSAQVGKINAETLTERTKPGLIGAQTQQAKAKASLDNRTNPNLRGGGSSNDPLLGLGRMQAVLENQKQAILSQMQQNGFIDKKTGQLTPPSATEGGFFGIGGHPSIQAAQYDTLKKQLDNVDAQLTGTGGASPKPNPGNPKPSTKPGGGLSWQEVAKRHGG